jgi:hypothetical protein
MKTQRFLLALGVSLGVLLAFNAVIANVAAHSKRQQALAALAHPPVGTPVVFLGNSLMAAGGDPNAFRSIWCAQPAAAPSLNLALSATSPVEHYLIWKTALAHDLRPKWLIYGFFDDQLNATARGDWSDLVGNRALSYYFPSEAAKLYAPGSSLKRWQLKLTAQVPMLSERSSPWSTVERWRRQLESIGLPAKKTNRFGRVDDFGPRSAAEIASFDRRCREITESKVGFSAPVRQIIELAHDHQIRVLFVEMPMPRPHRESFYCLPVWPRLRNHVRQLAGEAGVTYLNASDWVIDDSQFADALHLNPAGARVFSARLARELAQLDPTKALNGEGLAHQANRPAPAPTD